MTAELHEQLGMSEAIDLAADDHEFYMRTFFPKACPSKTPEFHKEIWSALESGRRYVDIEVFRDGAKTTLLRLFSSKRIAYAISRTIMFVGKGQDHAIKSVRWLKSQVEHNRTWANTYRLSSGSKWTDEWIEIVSDLYHDVDGSPVKINVVAYGMTGQIRGVNIEDYRPDLIIVDDPCDEENTATPEQRKKMAELFFGALKNCLVPGPENPTAMMCLLQTGLHAEDLLHMCRKDIMWHSLQFSIWDEKGLSRWPERKPTAEMKAEKEGFIQRNQLDLWLREMEGVLVNPQTSLFRVEWLSYWSTLPEKMTVVLAIDPVPPPTDDQVQKNLHNRDYEVIAAVGLANRRFYLLEYEMNRGHQPSWTIAKFFELAYKWKPLVVAVETVNYQATLKWILQRAMQERQVFYTVEGFDDKTKKTRLIGGAFSGLATDRWMYVNPKQGEFIEQFSTYPACAHNDVINAVALAVKKLREKGDVVNEEEVETLEAESRYGLPKSLNDNNWRSAP